jgi:hypothetical protein
MGEKEEFDIIEAGEKLLVWYYKKEGIEILEALEEEIGECPLEDMVICIARARKKTTIQVRADAIREGMM